MPSYYEIDLTGSNEGYQVSDYQRVVFKENQILSFPLPVFINPSFRIIKIDTTNEDLVRGIDWDVLATDIDNDAIAEAKAIDPDFNGTLVKSISIKRPFTEDYKVQVIYNQLYPNHISYAAIEREQGVIDLTPELVGNMVHQLEHIGDILANQTADVTPQSEEIKVIREDLTGTNDDNIIKGELHDVDFPNNVKIIEPRYGAFYTHDFILKDTRTDTALTVDVDYKFTEIDLLKTKRSSSHEPIFRGVEILKDMVGEVKIEYRAFGEQLDPYNLEKLDNRMRAIERYLNDNPYMTPSSLPGSSCILSLSNKIATLEENMRALIRQGKPTYADVGANTVLVRKIMASDNDLHWWNIAKLYRVEGSTEDIVADTMRFRFQSITTNFMFDLTVGLNLSTGFTGDKLTVTCDNVIAPDDILEKVQPMVRVITTTETGYPGAMLQIGMKLHPLSDTIALENLSGRESCWIFADNSENVDSPEDTDVLMPDNTTVWVKDDVGVIEIIRDIPMEGNIMEKSTILPITMNAIADVLYVANDVPLGTGQSLKYARGIAVELLQNPGIDDEILYIGCHFSQSDTRAGIFKGEYISDGKTRLNVAVTIPYEGDDPAKLVVVKTDDSMNSTVFNLQRLIVKY